MSRYCENSRVREAPDFPVVPWNGAEATFSPVSQSKCPDPWAVVVFVLDGVSFLLSRVPRGWCTPSGHVQSGETPEAAALRETKEETGATVTELRRIGDFQVFAQEGQRRCAAVYVSRLAAHGPIPAGSEATEARSFTLAELSSVYWRWDRLMERMFQYAQDVMRDHPGSEGARGSA